MLPGDWAVTIPFILLMEESVIMLEYLLHLGSQDRATCLTSQSLSREIPTQACCFLAHKASVECNKVAP